MIMFLYVVLFYVSPAEDYIPEENQKGDPHTIIIIVAKNAMVTFKYTCLGEFVLSILMPPIPNWNTRCGKFLSISN